MVRVATLIIAILCITRPAHAQSADALLHRAYELRLTGHDEAALPLLEQAYALDHSARVAAQLGLCDEAVGRWVDASAHLHEALAAPDEWVARHLEALQSAYAAVLSHFPRESSARPMTSRAPDDSNGGNTGNTGNSSAGPEGSTGAGALVPGNHLQRNWSGVAGDSNLQPAASGVAGNSMQPTASLRPTASLQPTPSIVAGAPLSYAAIIAGGVFIVGGVVSWIIRENIVDSFNSRGCRVGDPMPAAGCDAASAINGRNTTTALAITGLTAGGVIEIAGIALMLLRRRAESFPQRGITIGSGPGDVGVSVVGRF